MSADLVSAIKSNQAAFGLEIAEDRLAGLAEFYRIVLEYNDLLHLVAPCSAEEFAVRHVLESLTLLEHLPAGAQFADIGPGAGFPSIPCLVVRDDLRATLIESKEKKAKYLAEAAARLGIERRVTVVNKQFEEAEFGDATVVTCRALDKFQEKLPKMLKRSKGRKLLLFGGPKLRDAIAATGREFTGKLMPMSEQRYLFVIAEKKISSGG
ncbi:MAG: class I SAM-dependent methyltransferase [Pyrinomonadaceae bacterium]|nr:class I SAM-dependent methyltransferase [Pyrinomonadaceae bacterium]